MDVFTYLRSVVINASVAASGCSGRVGAWVDWYVARTRICAAAISSRTGSSTSTCIIHTRRCRTTVHTNKYYEVLLLYVQEEFAPGGHSF